MASDGVNVAEDADMAECDGDKVVTMMDVLQEQQEFEEDANAVLGASDDKNCTYSKGYIKRQALYACLTCCTEAKTDPTKRAGVCLACSLTCHENHELIELYTKRNFRCDCGNPKFNSHPCQFTPDKTDLNADNIYNQNFSGLYCTCQRPYPDPDSTFEDDMIQCIICEDWLHASHLEAVVPANDQYSEMVCKSCMEKNEFLHDYSLFAITVETSDLDIVTVNGDDKSADNSLCNGDLEKEELVNSKEENKTEIANVTVNEDVEVQVKDKVTDVSIKNEKTLQDDINKAELKSEEIDKLDSVNDSIINSNAESKIAEQSMEITETHELTKTNSLANPEDSNSEKENKETSKVDLEEQPDVNMSDAIVNTPKVKTELTEIRESTDEKTDDSNEKTDNTNENSEIINTESTQKIDETSNKQTEEQNNKQSTNVEGGAGDKVQETMTDSSENTEQQLLDNLSALTDDKPSSSEKEDIVTEANMINKEKVQTINYESFKGTSNDIGDSSKDKPVSETVTASGNVEVPDTSQTEKKETDNAENKTESVMDAIDELLHTVNKVKENIESASKSTEITETQDSKDIEIRASENKLDIGVSEKTANDNPTTSNDTEDVEMSDTIAKNEPAVKESKLEDEHNINSSDNKEVSAQTSNESNEIETTINDDKVDDESLTDVNEKSNVNDAASDDISKEDKAINGIENEFKTLSETDNELKTNDETDSPNKTEPSENDTEVSNVTENAKEHKRKLSTDLTEDISPKKPKLECMRPKGTTRVHKGATFWPSNFRQKLCTCGECLLMYKDLKVLFLTDLEDTVFAYESKGKENAAGGVSQYEKGLQALSSLDRIQQINAVTEFNKMRDKFFDFLKSFQGRNEVVKEEDIKAFFAELKPRREPDGVYFCR